MGHLHSGPVLGFKHINMVASATPHWAACALFHGWKELEVVLPACHFQTNGGLKRQVKEVSYLITVMFSDQSLEYVGRSLMFIGAVLSLTI